MRKLRPKAGKEKAPDEVASTYRMHIKYIQYTNTESEAEYGRTKSRAGEIPGIREYKLGEKG